LEIARGPSIHSTRRPERRSGFLCVAHDSIPPYVFTVAYDESDEDLTHDAELLSRSELVARGQREGDLAWSWTPEAPDVTLKEPATSPAPAGPAPANRRRPATVVTWKCGSLMRQMQPIELLIRFKRPDVSFLTETFLFRKHHRYLSKALAQGYVAQYSSLDTKGHGRRPRGGVAAVLVSFEWAGAPIPGYLDGIEVCTMYGHSHTLLAAHVPTGDDDQDLAFRVRNALYDASVAHKDRLVVAGDFNGVMPGERSPPSAGDSALAKLIARSRLACFSGDRRVSTYGARSAASGSRIVDCLVDPGAPAPYKETVLSQMEFRTHSIHRPLVSKVMLFPPRKGPSDAASRQPPRRPTPSL